MVSCLGMLSELCEIQELLLIPEEYTDRIHVCNYDEDTKIIVLRLTFSFEEEVKSFLQEWTSTSHVVWRISKKDPKNMSAGKRNLFWCSYHCQCSNLQLRQSKTVHVKHTDCKARMTVTIKRIVQYCRSRDSHLPNYPTMIKIHHDHNHDIYCKEILRRKDIPEYMRTRFTKLFADGFTPSSAMDMHLHDLYEQYGEDYILALSDRSIYPDLRWCYREFYGYLSKNKNVKNVIRLQEKVEKYNEKVGCRRAILSVNGKEAVIAICTPFMYYVHSLWEESGNVVFVDSVSSMNLQEHHLYTLSTVSPAGPLPLGIFIVPTREDHNLSLGLDNLIHVLHENGFYRKNAPEVILICLEDRNIFQRYFPNSKFYISIYHLLGRMWKFLYDSKNKIHKDKREYLFRRFEEMITTNDQMRSVDIYLEIKNTCSLTNYVELVDQIWEISKLWIVNDETVKKCSIGNAVLRIITDKITNRRRVYNYNILEIFEFITTRLDKYYEKFLSCYAPGIPKIRSIQRLFPYYDISNLIPNKTSEYIYEITEETSEKQVFIVNAKLWLCTCYSGQTGSSCRHQLLIYKHLNVIELFGFSQHAKSIFNKIISLLHRVQGLDEENIMEWDSLVEEKNKNDKKCIKQFKDFTEDLMRKAEMQPLTYIPLIREFNCQFRYLNSQNTSSDHQIIDNNDADKLIDELILEEQFVTLSDEDESISVVVNKDEVDDNVEYVTIYV